MHKPSVAYLVHKALFPRPRQGDPTTLSSHINRNLVPEVRIETANFYGALDCLEALYPGLDYSHPPHRRRLARFPWHKKLFRAFDELALTRNEILSLCQWEGTKSAKEKYERDVGRLIRDTTMDGIAPAEAIRPPTAQPNPDLRNWRPEAPRYRASRSARGDGVEGAADQISDGADVLANSSGNALNTQRRPAGAAPAAGDRELVLDEQLEQWLKEAMERNELDASRILEAISEGWPFAIRPGHILDASVNPPTLSLAPALAPSSSSSSSSPSSRSASRLVSGPASILSSQPPPASAPAPSLAASPDSTTAINDTQIAMVNVWNLGNEIARNVNAGNAAVVAPTAGTATTATTATAQTAGEAR